jgi:NmrA-like family
VRQGETLGDAAMAAGVQHYVYSSVALTDCQSGVPHFETMWQVEEHLRAPDPPLTIAPPVYFENFGGRALQSQESGDGYALAPTGPARSSSLPAASLRSPTMPPQSAMTSAPPWPTSSSPGAPRELKADIYLTYRFFAREGYQADTTALRADYPGLHTFEQWLAEGGPGHLRKAA